MPPRMLIAIPSLDYCPIDFACALAAMSLHIIYDKKMKREIAPAIIHQRGSNYVLARNTLVEAGRQLACTHILFLDSDMTFPIDTASRLISHHVPVVGANYCRREEANPSLLGSPLPNAPMRGVLRPMFHLPLGLMLLDMRVFDALPTPIFSYRHSGVVSEDTEFCSALRERGMMIYEDTTLTPLVGHVGTKVYRP